MISVEVQTPAALLDRFLLVATVCWRRLERTKLRTAQRMTRNAVVQVFVARQAHVLGQITFDVEPRD